MNHVASAVLAQTFGSFRFFLTMQKRGRSFLDQFFSRNSPSKHQKSCANVVDASHDALPTDVSRDVLPTEETGDALPTDANQMTVAFLETLQSSIVSQNKTETAQLCGAAGWDSELPWVKTVLSIRQFGSYITLAAWKHIIAVHLKRLEPVDKWVARVMHTYAAYVAERAMCSREERVHILQENCCACSRELAAFLKRVGESI